MFCVVQLSSWCCYYSGFAVQSHLYRSISPWATDVIKTSPSVNWGVMPRVNHQNQITIKIGSVVYCAIVNILENFIQMYP